MGHTSFLQNSFLGGEWSPLSQGKSNTEEYYTGMNVCLNYIPTDEGALARRGGLRFSAEARDGTVRLIPFLTSGGETYVCELSQERIRFHADGTLRDDGTRPIVSAISTATPAVVTTDTAHGWSTGDTVMFYDLSADIAPHVFNRQFVITVLSSTTFSLAHTGSLGTGSVDGSVFADATLANDKVGRITERTIAHTAAQLADIKYAEEQNNLYLFHAAHEPVIVDGAAALSVTELSFQDGPYLDENTTATTLTFSGTSGSVTVTASATTGINGGSGFQTTDIGRVIRVNTGTTDTPNWSWLRITARTSTTVVTATVLGPNLASASANTKWRLGLYSNTTGWPTVGVVHEGRLWLASDAAPGRLDSSKVFDFDNFAPTDQDGDVADDNAVSLIFAGQGRKNVQWLVSAENGLQVGADSSEWLVRASTLDDPITPFTVQVRQVTNFGSADIQAVRAGRNTIFVQAVGRALVEYQQVDRARDGVFDGNDIARVARHLTAQGIAEIAYAKVPVPAVWVRRADNRLLACTYRNDAGGQQTAWSQHNVAWADDPFDEDELASGRHVYANETGPVSAIAVAPFTDASNSRNDILWAAVNRNGTVCIEYMTPMFDDTLQPNEAFHVDSGNAYSQEMLGITWVEIAANQYRFYGLDRLIGDTVDLVFRGVDVGSAVVQPGGYVDMTLNETLDSLDSAYETSDRESVSSATLTFNASVLSKWDNGGTTPSDTAPPVASSAFLIGEDGKRYALKNVGPGNFAVQLWDIDAGANGPLKTAAQVWADAQAATVGVEPGGTWNGSGAVGAAVIVPGTAYVLFFGVAASGTDTDRYVSYYRVNSSGSLVLDGIYATGNGTLNVQFSPDQDNEAFSAMGHLFTTATPSSSGNYALEYPILVAYHGEGRSTICAVPAIQYVKNNTPLVSSGSSLWKNGNESDLADVGMAGVLDVDAYQSSNTSRGYFLPATAEIGSTRAFFLWHPSDVTEHASGSPSPVAAWLATHAPSYPSGFISSVRVAAQGTDFIGQTSSVANAVASVNNKFEGVAYPFPDIGLKYDDSSGSSADNFYLNPAVFPLDETEPFGDWLVFFPRLYRAAGDRDKLGVRVYRYNPKTQKYTHLSFARGQLYVLGTDVDASFNPEFVSLYWDRSNGDIIANVNGLDSSGSYNIVARFGTFTPTTGQLVAEAHVDGVLGLNYRSRGQILRPDLNSGARNGPALGKQKRTDRFNGLFYRTGQIKFGTKFTNLIELVLNDPDEVGRRPLFSGASPLRALQDSYGYDSMMAWEQARPDPGTIVAVYGRIETQDM